VLRAVAATHAKRDAELHGSHRTGERGVHDSIGFGMRHL
jgi:hypothetical protein